MIKELSIDQKLCTGCMICQQLCSYTFSGIYNTENAYIVVKPSYKETAFEVAFKPECTKCGICVVYCNYGALNFV